jgi:hypothetical protein
MKKSLFMVAAASVWLSVGALMAQAPGNRPMRSATERAKNETEQLVKELSLSADQQTKLYDINLKYAKKDSVRFSEMRNNGGNIDRNAMMEEMRKTQEAKTAEVNALLTESQQSKYKTYLENRQQRMRAGAGRPNNQ